MDLKKQDESLMETHQRIYADVLTTFRAVILLATSQAKGQERNYSPDVVAALGMTLNNEMNNMKRSLQEWLSLTRRMKELWLAGPLGGWEGDDTPAAREAQIEADSARCAELYNALQTKEIATLVEEAGGRWEPMRKEDFDRLMTGNAPATATATVTVTVTAPAGGRGNSNPNPSSATAAAPAAPAMIS